jgi:putative transposase
MKRLGQRYVQYINRTYQRSGTLWEGRFRSSLSGEERYIMACYRYIELNPVRAGMVAEPSDYRWSSYRSNALGEQSELLKPHPLYLSIGNEPSSRYRAYRSFFGEPLEAGMQDEIRAATNGNYVLGSEKFKAQIEAVLGRRVSPGRSGRPKKAGIESAAKLE